MTFLAPAWLGLLALAPLIVWWHLRHREPVEVASTRLWRLVAEGDQPRRVLKRPPSSLALLLQLLALVTLALASAEPRIGWLERRPTVLVLDAGAAASVLDASGDTRHASAAAAIAHEIRRRDGPWTLWRVTDRAEPVLWAVHDAHVVREALGSSVATHLASDWAAAAERILDDLPNQGQMIVVAADGAAAAEALAPVAERDGWTLEVRTIAAPFVNWSVDALTATPNPSRPGRWDVSVTVQGSTSDVSARPTELRLGFLPDLGDVRIDLEPEALLFGRTGLARVTATVDTVVAGVLSARFVGSDDFPGDDAAHLRIDPAPRPVRAAVIGAAAATRDPLVRALRAHGVEVVDDPANVDLVVVAGAGDPAPMGAPAVFWVGHAAGAEDIVRIDPGVATWDPGHPLAASTPWGRLEAAAALRLPLPADAATVVAGVAGPIVAARTTALRREAWVALDPSDPLWTGSAAFLGLVGDAVAWLTPAETPTSRCVVGAPCAVPLPVAVGGGEVRDGDVVVARWPALAEHVGAEIEHAWVPERAGLASWYLGTSQGHLAVDLAGASRAAVRAAMEARPAHLSTASRAPLWRDLRVWVLLAGLLVALEGVLAGRGRERFWRPAAWRGAGIVAGRRRATAAWHALAALLVVVSLVGAPWPLAWVSRVLVVVGDAPAGLAWPPHLRRAVAAHDANGVVDVERALAMVRAVTAGVEAAHVVWAPRVPVTLGSAERALVRPDGGRWPIDVIPPAARPPGDTAVVRLDLDRSPVAGDVTTLRATVHATTATQATLRVLRDGQVLTESRVDLSPGATLVGIPMPTPTTGEERWRVEIDADGDLFAGNDAAEAIVTVGPAPVVWVVTRDAERGASFVAALELQGYRASLRPPFMLPPTLIGFEAVDVVVLANLAALDLTVHQQEVLERWVRDRGGGLVLTGGERAFGPGGYLETPLDRLSPLSSNVPREAPEVALLFVLDRSGSMQQSVGGVSRLDIAKEATLRATAMLGPASQVAIVVFDEAAQVLLPWTPTADLDAVERALARLAPGGGTAMYPGLVLARDLLASMDAATRHVVLMTDGLSQPGDFAGVAGAIAGAQTTISTVAIGQGSDVERIREIAHVGGGMAHVTADFRALPGILAQEAFLLSVDPIVREAVTPHRTGADPGLMEALPDDFPAITTFVETTPKLAADVLLADDEDRPLLAAWRYGAGRVLAFPAQAVGPWVEAWTATEDFPRWWGQWLRWSVQPTSRSGLVVDATVRGDALLVRVTAAAADGEPLPRLDLEAGWTATDGGSRIRDLAEVGPGAYEAHLPLVPGDGTLHVVDRAGTLTGVRRTMTHTYPAVWRPVTAEADDTLAAWTGGSVLTDGAVSARPGGRFVFDGRWRWRPWLLLAALAWLASLATRYTPGWWRWKLRWRPGALRTRARLARPGGSARPNGP